jgi:hypothetical protein
VAPPESPWKRIGFAKGEGLAWRRMKRTCTVAFLASFALLGCSPVARLQVRFVGPSGSGGHTLYVTGVKLCPPGAIGVPAATQSFGDAFSVTQEPESAGAVIVTAAFRGAHCGARLTAWLDTDADGKPSPGDFIGSTPSVEIRDRGVFSSNLTRARDVVLSVVR